MHALHQRIALHEAFELGCVLPVAVLVGADLGVVGQALVGEGIAQTVSAINQGSALPDTGFQPIAFGAWTERIVLRSIIQLG